MDKLFTRSSISLTAIYLCLFLILPLSSTPAFAGKKVKPIKTETLTAEKLKTLDIKEVVFSYTSNGRKDPFRPFIDFSQIERSIPSDSDRPLTPLEKYALNQYHLVGIILAGDMENYALVEDPDNVGYTVRTGDMIGNMSGRVKEIKFNEVIIEEPYLDIFDKQQIRNLSLRLRDLEEESYLQLDN